MSATLGSSLPFFDRGAALPPLFLAVEPPPEPTWLPPMWPGEIDGRYINCFPDLGAFGDTFPSIGLLNLSIDRLDGWPMTTSDLQSAGSAWPNTLDTTKLIPTFGLYAPVASADTAYILTLTANTTTQGRLFVRYLLIQVAPWPGENPRSVPTPITLLSNDGGVLIVSDPNYPVSSTGLPAGSVWCNSGGLPGAPGPVAIVPGVTPNPSAPPVFFGQITSAQLLALGGGNLPLTSGSLTLIWNNGGEGAVSGT